MKTYTYLDEKKEVITATWAHDEVEKFTLAQKEREIISLNREILALQGLKRDLEAEIVDIKTALSIK